MKDIKKVSFDPNLTFENLNYDVKKNSNSIFQNINIDLEKFENEVNSLDNNYSNENYNQKTFDLKENKIENRHSGGENKKKDNKIDNKIDNKESDFKVEKLQHGGDKVEKVLDEKLKLANTLISKKKVKNQIIKYINNYHSNKLEKYYNELTQIYQKNIKKYYFQKDNNYLNLYERKTNKKVSSVKLLNLIITSSKLDTLHNEIKSIKSELINSYIFIKKNLHLKNKLEKDFNKKRDKYKLLLEDYYSFKIYHEIVNMTANNLDIDKDVETKLLYLSVPDLNIRNTPYKFNQKEFFNVPVNLIDEIFKYENKQMNLYNKIINSDKKNKKDILEYLENKKDKTITNNLKKIKDKKEINYTLLE